MVPLGNETRRFQPAGHRAGSLAASGWAAAMQHDQGEEAPSQFYTGLVAELYESLASEHARADDYIPFLERSGTPALELACGSGLPLLELVERGFEVEGLDASRDMLDRCRARAEERALDITLYHAEIQSFSLPRCYRSIFLAGASFTLLTTDQDAASALERIHEHLEPGGSALIPLEIVDVEAIRKSVGRFREVTTDAGDRLRVAVVALDVSKDGRGFSHRLRYEHIPPSGAPDVVERDWQRRCWSQQQFREMLLSARFDKVSFRSRGSGRAQPDAVEFVALARRGMH
jgi:SAM-dependent methyltransferase